ncbi:TatD family hydrolase [Alkalilimnicola sp. S0819]|uniref:TatD family hydrolase n=1 Tax=Alkalilimnicola sp. S0819 TaxID=2613922 RepID=UPI0012618118|nr:TatD family hydrolase [Alkalilimnicola sp. S0819]KAB7627609.1 TatD family deoxyribonuclease [Alkalilimnicola sp. S0819]MPQ15771.1 YchF/TatD family DNA exonuclease [Alkalilimnicola sp. S0819]
MLVDSHCHLHMLSEDPEGVLAAAAAEGVEHFLTVSVAVEEAAELKRLVALYPQVSASIGVHPCGEGQDPGMDELVRLAADPDYVAVGETGLDYFYGEGDLEWQRERFRRHVRAARQVRKPLIIHSRGAPEDTARILKEEGADTVGGIIHCFTEDYPSARRFLDLGFHISLSGILTFRNADALRETAARLPSDRLLVETDCPYLAPVPHRGKENRPAFVRHTAQCLAELHKMPLERMAEITSENFYRLFPTIERRASA